jgi:hypothetical protein
MKFQLKLLFFNFSANRLILYFEKRILKNVRTMPGFSCKGKQLNELLWQIKKRWFWAHRLTLHVIAISLSTICEIKDMMWLQLEGIPEK